MVHGQYPPDLANETKLVHARPDETVSRLKLDLLPQSLLDLINRSRQKQPRRNIPIQLRKKYGTGVRSYTYKTRLRYRHNYTSTGLTSTIMWQLALAVLATAAVEAGTVDRRNGGGGSQTSTTRLESGPKPRCCAFFCPFTHTPFLFLGARCQRGAWMFCCGQCGVATDVLRFDQFATSMHFDWMGPVDIVVITALISIEVGCVFNGVVVLWCWPSPYPGLSPSDGHLLEK
jgi:hypothetical protein